LISQTTVLWTAVRS